MHEQRVGVTAFLLLTYLNSTAILAVDVRVPGSADPWLAGMPDGETASWGPGGQHSTAPFESPVLVGGLDLSTRSYLTFHAAGGVSHYSSGVLDGPDGAAGFWRHFVGSENGISDIVVGIDSLLGVFLDDQEPGMLAPPATLDFSIIGQDFAVLTPALRQVFFIGDGTTGTGVGAVQSFVPPAGATRLFLSTMDTYGYANNIGAFDVSVTQQPMACDFNGDSLCNVDDLNLLLAEGPIAGGVPVTGQNGQFDLNGDGAIDLLDRDNWLSFAAIENGFAAPFTPGDANLDGQIDGTDFGLWNAARFTESLRWDRGNFNGDGLVDGGDFGLWNIGKFTGSDFVAVPEPSTSAWLLLALTWAFRPKKQRLYNQCQGPPITPRP